MTKISEIHDSLINGQRKQMTEQIDEYGLYDFFEDYKNYLCDTEQGMAFHHFQDAVISYHRIKNR